ncbi:hypothetical protein L1049_018498 [Liquidambar formosana]|uniref:Uncharacterized protein n=1 Tax=Liquidambar formosana TaxID=63359 RepID=A0AAP0RAX1_LIQFO
MRTSDSYAVEDKKAVTYCFEMGKPTDQDIAEGPTKNAQEDASHLEDGLSLAAAPREESVLNNEVGDSPLWKATSGNVHMFHAPPYTKENELTLKRLAKSVFELQHTD